MHVLQNSKNHNTKYLHLDWLVLFESKMKYMMYNSNQTQETQFRLQKKNRGTGSSGTAFSLGTGLLAATSTSRDSRATATATSAGNEVGDIGGIGKVPSASFP